MYCHNQSELGIAIYVDTFMISLLPSVIIALRLNPGSQKEKGRVTELNLFLVTSLVEFSG